MMASIRLGPVIKAWLRRRAPNETIAAAPAWSVIEIIAGVTLAGDAIAALRLEAPDGAAMPPLRLETWTAAACVDDRTLRSTATGDGHFTAAAVYSDVELRTIKSWRLTDPSGAELVLQREDVAAGRRAYFVRVDQRKILVPGDPNLLVVWGRKTLHHRFCPTFEYSGGASRLPPADLQSELAEQVKICRTCLPRANGRIAATAKESSTTTAWEESESDDDSLPF
ncbi:MAG: hypothetical protein ACK5XT_02750 [Gemmatimonas sp.]|uniref:hypothetical protein n=1 Tax=Gemmatimonas sp. TaxID=1962908 RepID=UPI00391F128C